MKTKNEDIKLVKVGIDNLDDLVDLEPKKSQYEFVADNCYSLAEAYANLMNGRYAQPFGIYKGDTPVGFLMIGFSISDEEDDPQKFPLLQNNYLIWRLMIDKKYQGKGYGRRAMELAMDFVRTFPCGKAEYCFISWEPENEVAAKLYRSCGFVENGEKDGDEIIAVMKL